VFLAFKRSKIWKMKRKVTIYIPKQSCYSTQITIVKSKKLSQVIKN